MTRKIVVQATWDPEAEVFTAESSDLPGLVTEAETLTALDAKLPGLIRDLLEDNEGELPDEVELERVVTSLSSRVRLAPAA